MDKFSSFHYSSIQNLYKNMLQLEPTDMAYQEKMDGANFVMKFNVKMDKWYFFTRNNPINYDHQDFMNSKRAIQFVRKSGYLTELGEHAHKMYPECLDFYFYCELLGKQTCRPVNYKRPPGWPDECTTWLKCFDVRLDDHEFLSAREFSEFTHRNNDWTREFFPEFFVGTMHIEDNSALSKQFYQDLIDKNQSRIDETFVSSAPDYEGIVIKSWTKRASPISWGNNVAKVVWERKQSVRLTPIVDKPNKQLLELLTVFVTFERCVKRIEDIVSYGKFLDLCAIDIKKDFIEENDNKYSVEIVEQCTKDIINLIKRHVSFEFYTTKMKNLAC